MRSVLLCLSLLMSSTVWAVEPHDTNLRIAMKAAHAQADGLLYEEALEGLETTSRSRSARLAQKPLRADLWAQIGRLRAELVDNDGAERAFRTAVHFRKDVQLARSVSPKIRQMLERARAAASDEPAKIVQRKTPVGKPRRKKRTPAIDVQTGPPLLYGARIIGEPGPGAQVRFQVEHANLPSGAVVLAMIKKPPSKQFVAVSMIHDEDGAFVEITVNRDTIEIYAQAMLDDLPIAAAGSAKGPLVVQIDEPPSLAEAWGGNNERQRQQQDVVPPVPNDTEPMDGTTKWTLIGTGVGVAVVAAVVTAVLLTSSDACDTREGTGCFRVSVLP